MEVFDSEPGFGHEQVTLFHDRSTGLKAIVAIHDTTLGPAAGGCRMWAYDTDELALADALRLSKAMTWKNALAGLPLGGGKSVIVGDSNTAQTAELLRTFGEAVQTFDGLYWTAEDVGIGLQAIRTIGETCDYTFGADRDPSPWTARGTLMAIRGAVAHRFGHDTLEGRRIAVQGVGNVGGALVGMLTEGGAHCTVTDVDEAALADMANRHDAEVVGIDEIFDVPCDVFAPCALGGAVHDETIRRIKAAIVAGSANNQLADPTRHGQMLHDAGIVYAPDYVANSGGMLAVGGDIYGAEHSDEEATALIDQIRNRVATILDRAAGEERPPADVAAAMARERVLAGRLS